MRTVLDQPATHAHDRAIRWRQLVELAARGGDMAGGELFEQAISTIEQDRDAVDERVRMAAARAIAALPAPVALIGVFAGDKLGVAAPLLAAARLTPSEWADISLRASPECARFIASLRGEQPRSPAPPRASVNEDAAHEPEAVPTISEVVARIERLRKAREQPENADPATAVAPPQPDHVALFRWECDEAGDISWVDGAPRGALIGRSIGRPGPEDGVDARVERAFLKRVPFREANLELAEGTSLGGQWKISGKPAFEPSSGRFAGYRGIAERDSPDRTDEPSHIPIRDPDSLRELAHEIKTPLNAIIGFAEIIAGQYLGAANRSYRDRAQEIVRQARLLLAAVDDLDLAARLHSQAAPAAHTALAPVVARVSDDLDGQVTFGLTGAPQTSLDEALSERLISRFCKAVAAHSDEPLTLFVESDLAHTIISVGNPGLSDEELSLGLRLVAGLARIAGGDLIIDDKWLKLLLPRP